jgi:Ca2+-binding EF-hand superfamily protein
MNKPEPTRALRLAFVPAACAALLAACAPYPPADPVYGGGPAADPQAAAFARLDINRDGFLSRAEAEALGVRSHAVSIETTTSAFHRLDANGDGFLSKAEAEATLAGIPGASFEASDADRDGFLNLAEASPHLRWLESRNIPAGAAAFETLDANRDGFLSRAEADPVLRNAQISGGRYVTAPRYTFDGLDTNRDGFLSRAEAAPAANPLTFDRYDGNRDGYLSRAESDLLLGARVGGTSAAPGGTVYGPR